MKAVVCVMDKMQEKNNAIIGICSLSEYIHDFLGRAEIYSNVTSQLMSWWGSSERLFIRNMKEFSFCGPLDFFHISFFLSNISETPRQSHKN